MICYYATLIYDLTLKSIFMVVYLNIVLALGQKFRMGGYNVIVATSIGEEGLDIMEVDLVICFDANISPLRMIQRMGRTGRKRDGRVDILGCLLFLLVLSDFGVVAFNLCFFFKILLYFV